MLSAVILSNTDGIYNDSNYDYKTIGFPFMKNLGQLTWNYSMERGMICDGETQLRVWNRMLDNLGVIPSSSGSNGGTGFLATIAATATRKGKHPQQRQPTAASLSQRTTYSSNDCTFLLLEPPFVPSVVSEGVDCILFRELGLGKVARLLGPCMAAIQYHMFCQSMPTMSQPLHPKNDNQSSSSSLWINDNTKCCCVVDSGYSFTHVVPTQNAGEAITTAIRRLDPTSLARLLPESLKEIEIEELLLLADEAAAEEIGNAKLFIDDTPALPISQVAAPVMQQER